MTATVLRLTMVEKRIGKRTILRDIGIELHSGSITQLKGRNGSGKSTLLQIAAGVSLPSAGVRFVPKRGEGEGRPVVGFVPERFPRLRFSAEEYLRHMGRMRGVPKDELLERIHALAARFALPLTNKRADALSKGTAQKVNLIQAFLQEPRLLVLDEPFSGLDAGAQETLAQLLRECRDRGSAILLTCHEHGWSDQLTDRMLELKDGVLVPGIDAESSAGMHSKMHGADGSAEWVDEIPHNKTMMIRCQFADRTIIGDKLGNVLHAGTLGIFSAIVVDDILTIRASRRTCDSVLGIILKHGGSILQVTEGDDPSLHMQDAGIAQAEFEKGGIK